MQFRPSGLEKKEELPWNDTFLEPFELQVKRACEYNGWFTRDNVFTAFYRWGMLLNDRELKFWTSNYNLNVEGPKKIAVILAGNIPLVGFHDFLSVLVAGHHILVKQSASDSYFLPLIARFLERVEPEFKGRITFTDDRLEGFDAVIATGSNNTARHFEYYFGKYPNIIRRNRNSVAVLTGRETEKDLENLGEDIFRYFGLGCRSVSKLFVPEGYDFDMLFRAIYAYKDLIHYEKYSNNYDYNKAVYLMSRFQLLENGFLMLKEDSRYSSPIATLFYEYYGSEKELMQRLQEDADHIQCIVGCDAGAGMVAFGKTQKPGLMDYADGTDTLKFLQDL